MQSKQLLSDPVSADGDDAKLALLMAGIITFVEHHQFLSSFFFVLWK